MGLARAHAVALVGVAGHMVEVEAHVSNGLPAVIMVGLPDTALREARDRIRAAILNSGLEWPGNKITIGLSPASLPKHGSGFDLSIAVAILAASAHAATPMEIPHRAVFVAELGLDGRLRPVPGVLPAVVAAAGEGVDTVVVAGQNRAEAALVPGLTVVAATWLLEVVMWLRGGPRPAAFAPALGDASARSGATAGKTAAREAPRPRPGRDMSEVLGQYEARRAVEVCAAGGHNLSLLGPPGAGKTMLAERLPTILPRLTPQAALEVTSIHSVAGTLAGRSGLISEPPFCAPHHTATMPAIVGGGSNSAIRPGAASLAHRGVLFLDESRNTLRIPCKVILSGAERQQKVFAQVRSMFGTRSRRIGPWAPRVAFRGRVVALGRLLTLADPRLPKAVQKAAWRRPGGT
jgi:magnesium chelatase family protein